MPHKVTAATPPGLGARLVGAAAGSVLGTVVGTTVGPRAAGARPADFQRRLGGAIGGLLFGGLAVVLVESAMQRRHDRTLVIASFAAGQGLFAGIVSTASPASADSTAERR